MFKKGIITTLLALSSLFAMAGLASAHATVQPKSVNANSYEVFILRVPNEKTTATTQVKVEIPEGFAVSRVQPVPGWKYEFTKTADGKTVTAITFSGGKVLAGEFQDFPLSGKSAEKAGKYAWKVYQTYEDGETVAWAGPSDANTPASVMEVKAAAATTDDHGQPTTPAPAPATPATPAASAPAPAPAATSPITTAAAYGGLLLGAGALIIALRRK